MLGKLAHVLEVRGLCKSFGNGPARVDALRGVDLTLAAGEFVALTGASGSGKSTLLHLIAGLDYPDSGTVRLDVIDLTSLNDDQRTLLRRRHIGLIFQSFHLLDMLTASENVSLPLAIAGVPPKQAKQRTFQALADVGMDHRLNHRPDQLSGGERQRVAIARALVINPIILLADEPTGNLDSQRGREVMNLLRRLVDRRHLTLCLVTHAPEYAALADRVVHMRDGRLDERREIPSNPVHAETRDVA